MGISFRHQHSQPATVGKRKQCALAHLSPLKRALRALHKSHSPDPNVIVDRLPRELCLNEDRPPRELCLNEEDDVASGASIKRDHDDVNLAIDEILQTDDDRSWVSDLVGDELLEGEDVHRWSLNNVAGVVEKKTVSRLARVQIDAKRHGRDNSMRWEYDVYTMLGAWCDHKWFSAAEIRSFV